MSGLIKETSKGGGGTFVNIADGTLVCKKQGEIETYSSLCGVINKVEFIEEQFKGENIEKAKFYISNGADSYILQMRTNSGYFRGFCNSLRSGNPTKEVTITPSSKTNDKGLKNTTCFVNQNDKYLKHFFNKDFNGDDKDSLPDVEKTEFKGKILYDWTKINNYWKSWLLKTFEKTKTVVENEEEIIQNDDDLPF
jgi:hypothetical protein